MTVFAFAFVCIGLTASAQAPSPPYVATVVDLEVVPAELERFLAALKENAAATIKEPGCRRYDFMQSATNPSQILIYEVYENAAAVQVHRDTEHFKRYVAVTKDMVAKRQSRPMVGLATHSK
jgi:autoinducer 2-degrading protein